MKIFVAGATGVLGRVLVPLLLEQGHEIAAFSRRGATYISAEVRQFNGDIFDREQTLQHVRSFSPEVLVHLVTDLKQRNSSANADIRAVGTRYLVDAAREAGVRKIVAQSIAWAYEPGESAAVEATSFDYEAAPPRKVTIDGVAALERISGEMPEHTILRLGVLYGPNTWYSREGWVAKDVQDGRIAANRAITNFLHVDDAAQTFVEALSWPDGPVNIVDDEPAFGSDWLPQYALELGAPPPPRDDSLAPAGRAVSNRLAHTLGWNLMHPSSRGGFF